ncbi:uncharacterized protein BDZ83DRAFT_630391 [Colletotrichum acutatum]|uniref:Uncharacterized protein n=1 Tax=Glomerella acutata TaxID=27357 RepID=A0AAD8UDR7_GLOAC|nr:uncharacterized protein BDZ83DRAFT_630391 [Colletotrichum acutatum]KAK1721290.1 hypothetical protein BDZ83DRAFT_630391 [Colletotrichum acutatum]
MVVLLTKYQAIDVSAIGRRGNIDGHCEPKLEDVGFARKDERGNVGTGFPVLENCSVMEWLLE